MHRIRPTKNTSEIASARSGGFAARIQCRVSNSGRCPRHEKVCTLLVDHTTPVGCPADREVGYGVVQLFRWSQSSSNQLTSDGLFKIALGAALAATNLMIIEGSLFRELAVRKAVSWRLNAGRHSIRNLFSPKLARAGALGSTARTRSSFHRETPRMRSSTSREAR